MEVIDKSTISHQASEPICRPTVFGPGDVSRGGVAYFLDEELCRSWVLGMLHPNGAQCPGCAVPIASGQSLQSFWNGARVKCCRCGKYFTALTDTFLSGVHLSYAGMIMMAILLDAQADDSQIARILNMSTEGIRGWRLRFANAAQYRRCFPVPPLISGVGDSESRDAATGGAGADGEDEECS